jgi:hypothetical protein
MTDEISPVTETARMTAEGVVEGGVGVDVDVVVVGERWWMTASTRTARALPKLTGTPRIQGQRRRYCFVCCCHGSSVDDGVGVCR